MKRLRLMVEFVGVLAIAALWWWYFGLHFN